jgi:hypothetical protein
MTRTYFAYVLIAMGVFLFEHAYYVRSDDADRLVLAVLTLMYIFAWAGPYRRTRLRLICKAAKRRVWWM